MKSLKNLFMLAGICVIYLFNTGTVNAENWIYKDTYKNAQWDADSVYSDDYGNIINFTMQFYNHQNDTTTFYLAQIHKRELLKFTYGRVYDSNGNLLEEGPLSMIYPVNTYAENSMFFDIVQYYNKYVKR